METFIKNRILRHCSQNPIMPVIILDADFTDLHIYCLKFASIDINQILKITGKWYYANFIPLSYTIIDRRDGEKYSCEDDIKSHIR